MLVCACLGMGLVASACRPNVLNLLSGALLFSSPDEPAELMQPDAGVVQIAFGQVLVGSTKTMTLAFASLGSSVTLGTVTPVPPDIQPDAEFSLPFVPGTVVQTTPSQITVSFTPASAGNKAAVLLLTDYSPGTGTVVFELSGVGVDNGLSIVPNPVDFGNVEINRSQSVTLTIANTGALMESLVLSPLQGPDPARFTLGSASPTTLAPGNSATLNVAFVPLVDGAASASFTVSVGMGSAAEPVTVNLSGTGVDSWIQVTSPLEFGFVQLGDSIVKSATIKNLSSYTTLHLVAPAPAVTQPIGQSVFSPAATGPAIPVAIPPGQSVLVPVTFTPSKLAEFSGTLVLSTDDPLGEFPVVELDGYGGGPRLACLPSLPFGPTPLGHPVSLSAPCFNAGADIPSHPEIKLEIAVSGISTDDPAVFAATLILPDGGVAGQDDGVKLSSGQTANIEVRFTPPDSGVYLGLLRVASSDPEVADAGTRLTGEGIVPGPCVLEAVPRQLSFGDVQPGSARTLPFKVQNVGQDLCIVSHVTLDHQSAAGFSLPQGDPGYQLLSYPGDPNNPIGRPSALSIPVQYASSGVLAAAGGTVDIASPNASLPDPTVALVASSAYGCFTIVPKSFDFGTVPFGQVNNEICVNAVKTFMGFNGCGAAVVVSQLALGSGDGGPQFTLAIDVPPPFTVDAGDQVPFYVSFTPTRPGPESASILVASSDSQTQLASEAASVRGNTRPSGLVTDTFIVPNPPKELDLVWILDDDDDLQEIQSVAALLPQIVDLLNAAKVDWQMAVTSTDTCDAGHSDIGLFEPCDHCISQDSSDATYFTPTADAGDALVNLFAFPHREDQGGLCAWVNGDEHFFDSIAEAFSAGNLGGHNARFLRAGAHLRIVMVNGDGVDDQGPSGMPGPYLTSLGLVTTVVEGLKPDAGMVSVSYVNKGGEAIRNSQQIGKLVDRTNGSAIDTSQAAAIWQNELLDGILLPGESGEFRLSETPASPSGIDVRVNGVLVTNWSYDPFEQAIIFAPTDLPTPGSTVTATYLPLCM